MNIRAGYRQTEVGVVPDDWEVLPLRRLSPKQGVGVVVNPSTYFDEHGTVPMLVGSNIQPGRITWATANRITEASNEALASYRLSAGDLVMVRVGAPGVTAVVPPELDGCSCASMMIVRKHLSFDSTWLCYAMNSRAGRRQVEHVQYGTAQKQFNISDAVNFTYAVPPLPEQRAIAEALSDVDALIESLDQLIAKKRDIKQAAMQQLLTGQTRLPSFRAKDGYQKISVGLIPEDWRCLAVPQVVSGNSDSIKIGPFGSSLKKEFLVATGYKVYGQENLYARDMALGVRYISHARFMELRACEIRPGDFLISMMGTVGKCLVAPKGIEAGIMDSHLLRLRLAPEVIDAAFLAHIFETPIVLRQVKQLSVGGIMEGLSSKIIRGIALPVPSVPEQTAIAAVLSDMDAELAALETRRDKTRALKQGMMQELLTGRTRLI